MPVSSYTYYFCSNGIQTVHVFDTVCQTCVHTQWPDDRNPFQMLMFRPQYCLIQLLLSALLKYVGWNIFIPALLISIISINHSTPLSVALALAHGHNSSRKQNKSCIISRKVFNWSWWNLNVKFSSERWRLLCYPRVAYFRENAPPPPPNLPKKAHIVMFTCSWTDCWLHINTVYLAKGKFIWPLLFSAA